MPIKFASDVLHPIVYKRQGVHHSRKSKCPIPPQDILPVIVEGVMRSYGGHGGPKVQLKSVVSICME